VEIAIAAYRYGLTVILIDHTSQSRVNSILNTSKPQAFFIDPHLKTAWAIEHANCIEIKRKCAGKKIFNKIFAKKVIQEQLKMYNQTDIQVV
jgi:hypothetical protein